MGKGGHTVPGNTRRTTALINPPDRWSIQLASGMAIGTAPFSPMARGVEPNGKPGFMKGVRGNGVNRASGRTAPQQGFSGAIVPIAAPGNYAIGTGAGVAGQPGWPSTGDAATGVSLSMPNFYGMGG